MRIIKKLLLTFMPVAAVTALANDDVNQAEKRIAGFNFPENMAINVWADTTLTQNPGFFYFDTHGRMFINEIYRIYNGVGDVRAFSKEATFADILIETLDDRTKMYHQFPTEFEKELTTKASDLIRLVQDTDQDGKADKSQVFADGFNHHLDGLAAGVIERDGKVYSANIPHVWILEDNDNNGIADKQTSMQKGFGTRVSFLGHDMHGFAWGPDGRLYWSLGDRGYHFTSKEGVEFHKPNFGAVFRSQPDGSNIEVFYHGLRNAQELAFDEYGNLFTADNDGDRGDFERFNHLIEGGDSGWHAGNQTTMSFGKRLELRSSKYTGGNSTQSSWLVNDMSLPRNDNQPAYMLPGIAKFLRGPSGITYNPSNYLGDEWRHTFFITHYTGSPANSYISTLKLAQNGASFLATNQKEFSKGANASDVDFGPDGRLYMAEFNFGGWGSSNQGAIFAINNKNLADELKQQHASYTPLLINDYHDKSITELITLLSIDHQHIRQRAQFEIAKRGKAGYKAFDQLAHDKSQPLFARIHSIWGLSQLVFNDTIKREKLSALLPLLQDNNPQVRIQTTRVLGDHAAPFAAQTLINALDDQHPQVVMYAALGLGKLNQAAAINSVINKLEQNNDQDLWLRHALTMTLKGTDKKHWLKYKNHPDKAVRMGILLALRLLEDADVAYFLKDKEITLVNEAIVAIEDKNIISARPQVAALLDAERIANTDVQAYMHFRIINANFNEGRAEDAKRLLDYISHQGLSDKLASEALAAIEGWHDLNPIDTITGLPSTANASRANIKPLVLNYLPKILARVKGQSLVQAMRIAGKENFDIAEQTLIDIASAKTADEARIQALALLTKRLQSGIVPIVQSLLDDQSTAIKTEALKIIASYDQPLAVSTIVDFLQDDRTELNKIALAHLALDNGHLVTDEINQLLIQNLTALAAEKHKVAIALELIAVAEKSNHPKVKALLAEHKAKLETKDIVAQFANSLEGGDAKEGKKIVLDKAAVQCTRCHKVGANGSKVGPELTHIAYQHSATYLLEALVDPSAKIAPGYGTYTITMKNGENITGIFFGETETTLTLGKNVDKQITYQKSDIANIEKAVSGMPPMNYLLTAEEIRDVIAFLLTLNSKPVVKGH